MQINLISAGTEKCTSHITSQDQAGGRCLSSQNYKESLQTDMNLQLVSHPGDFLRFVTVSGVPLKAMCVKP